MQRSFLYADSLLSVAGESLSVGDEVAVYRPNTDLCVGSAVWTGDNLAITVWGDDSATATVDGLVAGEALSLRAWQQATGAVSGLGVSLETEDAVYQTDALLMSNRAPSAVGMLSNQINSSAFWGYLVAFMLLASTGLTLLRSRRVSEK